VSGPKVHEGLTWDHPRGFSALATAAELVARERGHPLVRWARQPLEGFESHPIGELAARYDLLVLDHPHLGEAVALDCLRPLDEVFGAEDIAGWRERTAGPALESYLWAGRHWALPLDVATQVAAYRPDLVAGPPPATWAEVLAFAERKPVALSIAGPHAILCLFSIAVALGRSPEGEDLLPDAVVHEAFAVLARLHARAPAGSGALNPIGLLEAMARGGDIALVPLVYGYVNYAGEAPGRHRVAFADAPAWREDGRPGTVLGGTGIALTRRAVPDRALLEHLRWLMSEPCQVGFIPAHDGQPSARAAWLSQAVNPRWGGFYRATLASIEQAWVRPRFDGYIAFQTEAARLIRAALDGALAAPELPARLRRAWHESRARARGPLT
jgi:multiple sugar transport system substrate-binding protein